MTELNPRAYAELEEIVGTPHISQAPAIRDTYNQIWGNKMVYGEKWSIRPAAVLLPAGTEEIERIIRVCNEYRIRFKALSSGFEVVATGLEREGSIILDLRRMDKILEIDPVNMRATVQPYVSVLKLQLEAAKHGLYIGSIGAGYSTGVIASACCHFGSGATNVSTGGLDRNILGCEWVLPTGETIRLGAGGTGHGKFSADGPGPGIRGILRGHGGANGGHGVITEASVKLYPWNGPARWENKRRPGQSVCHLALDEVPERYRCYIMMFPDNDAMNEAYVEICQEEVIVSALPMAGGSKPTDGNDEMRLALEKIDPALAKEMSKRVLSIVVGSETDRELEFRDLAVRTIMEKWGGVLPPFLNGPDQHARFFTGTMWSAGIALVFRPTTDFFITPTMTGTQDAIRAQAKVAEKLIDPYMEKGSLLQMPGGVGLFQPAFEHYSTGSHIENVYMYDPFDEESLKDTRELIAKSVDPEGEFAGFAVPLLGGGLSIEPELKIHERYGAMYENYTDWHQAVKRMLDPNDVGDWSAYIPPVFP